MSGYEIIAAVGTAATHHDPEIRSGQAAFNMLYSLDPIGANQIRGTSCDPFHNNQKLPIFFAELGRMYQERGLI